MGCRNALPALWRGLSPLQQHQLARRVASEGVIPHSALCFHVDPHAEPISSCVNSYMAFIFQSDLAEGRMCTC